MLIEAVRYHDISCGHRVHGHESKCAHLHGHNYRVHFHCEANADARATDELGRVLDFSVIKSALCMWLEDNWDHKFLAWDDDPLMRILEPRGYDHGDAMVAAANMFRESIVWVPFNPTAENMAHFLLRVVAPRQLRNSVVQVTKVVVEETRKCSATARIGEAS